MQFEKYRRTQIAEMAPWEPECDMTRVSVSASDREAGSPKAGDMIARNPVNHDDQWLVAPDYFSVNFEPMIRDSGGIGSLDSSVQAALNAHHAALALSDEHTCEICGLLAFASIGPR